MIGDDREKELVETQQLRLIDIVVANPAVATVERCFDGFEKVGDAGFKPFCGQPHLGFCQPVDSWPADQRVDAECEDGE